MNAVVGTNVAPSAVRVVFSVPGKPAGQPRHRTVLLRAKGGRLVHDTKGNPILRPYTPKDAVDYRATIQAHAATAMRALELEPHSGPVRAEFEAVWECPKSAHRKTAPRPTQPHTSKPDADNVAKMVMDACNGVVYIDDSQVSQLVVSKRRGAQGEPPRVIVTFTLLPEIPT